MVLKRTVVAKKPNGKETVVRISRWSRRSKLQPHSFWRSDFKGVEGKIRFVRVKIGNRVRRMAVKKFRLFQSNLAGGFETGHRRIEVHFKMYQELRKIPEIRPFVLPTMRRIGKRELLVTDLTQNGKFIVKTGPSLLKTENSGEVAEEMYRIEDILLRHGFRLDDAGYAYVGQIDPKTNRCVKIWITDMSGVFKEP